VIGLGVLVTESSEMLRACSPDEDEGNSQFETREKDFFFLSGGCGDWRTNGRGGGGWRDPSERPGHEGGPEEPESDGEGVLNAAEASLNGLSVGIGAVFDGAVFGR